MPSSAKARTTETWDEKMERLRSRKNVERTVRLHDDQILDEFEQAQERLDDLRKEAREVAFAQAMTMENLADRVKAVEEAVEASDLVIAQRKTIAKIEKRMHETDIPITLRGIGSDAWEDLIAAHPPTPEQEKAGEVYNVKTFPAEAIAASSTEGMTVDDAKGILAAVSVGEASRLFQVCVAVNQSERLTVGKG